MLEIKTMITEMKNTFNGLVNKLDTGTEKKSVSLETWQQKLPKMESKENEVGKKWSRISTYRGTITKGVTYMK